MCIRDSHQDKIYIEFELIKTEIYKDILRWGSEAHTIGLFVVMYI